MIFDDTGPPSDAERQLELLQSLYVRLESIDKHMASIRTTLYAIAAFAGLALLRGYF